MGRKIPAKKHRGVKDPAQQQAKRLQSLKGKINAPPKDPDEQPVPRSLTQLFAFQEPKTEKHVKKKKPRRFEHGSREQNYSNGRKNPISQMKKLPGESGRSFSLRINSAIKTLHGVVEDQDYPLDIEEDEDVKGERMDAQRRRRERKRKRGGAAAGGEAPLRSRARRLALKKEAKKQKELEANQDKREVVYERVRFGEVAHAPPALSFGRARRAQPHGDAAPPLRRRSLLLSKMLAGGGAAQEAGGAAQEAGGAAPARARARSLPAAERVRRERARQAAVDAYRALKATALANKPDTS